MIGGLGTPFVWWFRKVWKRSRECDLVTADVILVLGRTLENDQITRVFAERLKRGAELWRLGLAPRIVVAGGMTGRATRTEAEAGLEELLRLEVPDTVVLAEGRSRHTLENLFHVREMLGRDRPARILIVSDPIHTARTSAYAQGLGLDHYFAPAFAAAPVTRLGRLARTAHEAIFLHWYHSGVWYSRLTRNQRYLSRVT